MPRVGGLRFQEQNIPERSSPARPTGSRPRCCSCSTCAIATPRVPWLAGAMPTSPLLVVDREATSPSTAVPWPLKSWFTPEINVMLAPDESLWLKRPAALEVDETDAPRRWSAARPRRASKL